MAQSEDRARWNETISKQASSSCHQCKSRRTFSKLTYCTSNVQRKTKRASCRKKYCDSCLRKFYKEQPPANAEGAIKWICPSCRGTCLCAACRRRRSEENGGVDTLAPQLKTKTSPKAKKTKAKTQASNRPKKIARITKRAPNKPKANETTGGSVGEYSELSKQRVDGKDQVFSLQPRVAKSCDSCTETSDVFATHIALTHLPHVQEAISRINNHRLEDAEKVTRISTLIRQEFNKLFPNKGCFHNQQSTAEIMQLFQRTPRFTGQSSPQFMPSSATMNGKRAESPSALSLAQSQMGFSSTNFPTSFSPRLTAVNTAFSPRLKAAQGFVHKLPPNNLVQFSPRLSPNMSPQMIPQSAVFSSTSFSPRLSASISPIPMPMSMASATASQKAAASRAGGKRGPSNLSLDGKASTLTLLAAATQMTNSTNSMLANQSKAKESPLVIPFASSVVHSSSILAPAPVLHKAIQK